MFNNMTLGYHGCCCFRAPQRNVIGLSALAMTWRCGRWRRTDDRRRRRPPHVAADWVKQRMNGLRDGCMTLLPGIP
jgi:hypothetical protein